MAGGGGGYVAHLHVIQYPCEGKGKHGGGDDDDGKRFPCVCYHRGVLYVKYFSN